MSSQNGDPTGNSRRSSTRTRQKRDFGDDFVDPSDKDVLETIRKSKTPSRSPVPISGLIEEIKMEVDEKEKQSSMEPESSRVSRRSGRQIKPTAKILGMGEAMKEVKREIDDYTEEKYEERIKSATLVTSLVARCPTKVTVNRKMRQQPVMYTGQKDLCEKKKPQKSNAPRPINRVYAKRFNPTMTPVDGIIPKRTRYTEEQERLVTEKAEATAAKARAANLAKEEERKKSTSLTFLESTSTIKRVPPGLRFQMSTANDRESPNRDFPSSSTRTPDSQLIPVRGPLRMAIVPRGLHLKMPLKVPKDEDDYEFQGELQAPEETKPETINGIVREPSEAPEMKPAARQVTRLPVMVDKKTGRLLIPSRNGIPMTTTPDGKKRLYAVRTISTLSKPKGSQITTRTVTVLSNAQPSNEVSKMYLNKDGSAPGPSSAPDPVPMIVPKIVPTVPVVRKILVPSQHQVTVRIGPDGQALPTRRIVIKADEVEKVKNLKFADHCYSRPNGPMSPDRINFTKCNPPPVKKLDGNRELHYASPSNNLHPLQPQIVDELKEEKPVKMTITAKIDGTFKTVFETIKEKHEKESMDVDCPTTGFGHKRMVLTAKRPTRNPVEEKVALFMQHQMDMEESQMSSDEEERPSSPVRIFLGAQEPMKDLDEDEYSFNRITIKRVKEFTPQQLRPFGKRPPGRLDDYPGPGLSVVLLPETDAEGYALEKKIAEMEIKQKKKMEHDRMAAEVLRQKKALARRMNINERKIWDFMQSEEFKKTQKPESEMSPMERILLQHDALAKIPAYSESLSEVNPKLYRNLKKLTFDKILEKPKYSYPVRSYKKKLIVPKPGRVCGPIRVDMDSADDGGPVDRPLTMYSNRPPKLLRVVYNNITAQVPDEIKCHLCEYVMRLCMRKSNYRGELREYPAYRCLHKGCQTFRSIKKYLEGEPPKMRKPRMKKNPIKVNEDDPLSKFLPKTIEEFKERQDGLVSVTRNLRSRKASRLTKLLKDFVVDASPAEIARKDLEEEESDGEGELVEWSAFPGVQSPSTEDDSGDEERQLSEDEFIPYDDVEEEDYYHDYSRPEGNDTSPYEDEVEEEPYEYVDQEHFHSGDLADVKQEEPELEDSAFMLNEIKEEIDEDMFMENTAEQKPEFLLDNSSGPLLATE